MTQPLEQAVINILNNSLVPSIRFRWNGTTIQNINRIAGLIPARVGVALTPAGSSPTVFHYNTRSNVLLLSRDPTPAGTVRNIPAEAGVMHEAVHALLDLERFGGDDMDAEAMCYIAQAMYHSLARSENPDSGGYHRLGRQVADWAGRQNSPANQIPSIPDTYREQFFQVFAVSPLYRRLVDQTRTAQAGGHIVSTRIHGYNGISGRQRVTGPH